MNSQDVSQRKRNYDSISSVKDIPSPNFSNYDNLNTAESDGVCRSNSSRKSSLFSNARGDPMVLSNESILKAKNILGKSNYVSDCNIQTERCQSPKDDSGKSLEGSNHEESLPCMQYTSLFSTAKGKSVIISEKSALQGRSILRNSINNESEKLKSGQSYESKSTRFIVDELKSNRREKDHGSIVDHKMLKTPIIASNMKYESNFSGHHSSGKLSMFSTARNKPVVISKQSLSQAREILGNRSNIDTSFRTNSAFSETSNVCDLSGQALVPCTVEANEIYKGLQYLSTCSDPTTRKKIRSNCSNINEYVSSSENECLVPNYNSGSCKVTMASNETIHYVPDPDYSDTQANTVEAFNPKRISFSLTSIEEHRHFLNDSHQIKEFVDDTAMLNASSRLIRNSNTLTPIPFDIRKANGGKIHISLEAIERAKLLLGTASSDCNAYVDYVDHDEISIDGLSNSALIRADYNVQNYPLQKTLFAMDDTRNDDGSETQYASVTSVTDMKKLHEHANPPRSEIFDETYKHFVGLGEIFMITNENQIQPMANASFESPRWHFPDLSRDALMSSELVYFHDIFDGQCSLKFANSDPTRRHVMDWMKVERFRLMNSITSSNVGDIVVNNYDIKFVENNDFLSQMCNGLSNYPLSRDMMKWVSNQLNWLIWTFASYEKRYPQMYLDKLLNWKVLYYCISHRYRLYNTDFTSLKVTCCNDPGTPMSSSRHVSAYNHFRKKGAMSHLQRYSEILSFNWPMILCILIKSANDSQGYESKVTDGWWLLDASVDSSILRLIEKGKLRDGTKIAVFSGSIRLEDRKPRINLTVNNIRKAKRTCRLGHIPPAHLMKGIPVKSIEPGGGLICALQLRILFKTCPMSKLKLGEKSFPVPSQHWRNYQQHIENNSTRELADSVATSKDVEMMINKMNCDEWIKKTLKLINNGGTIDSQLSNDDFEKLKKAMKIFEDVRLRYLETDTMKPIDIKELNQYFDILAKCLKSGEIIWLRLPIASDSDNETSAMNSFLIGDKITVTNVMPFVSSQYKSSQILTVAFGPSSRVLKMKKDSVNAAVDLITMQISDRIPLLRNIIKCNDQSIKNLRQRLQHEITFESLLVDWREVDSNHSFVTIEIQAIDASSVTALITYSLPVAMMEFLLTRKLKKGKTVRVHLGNVVSIDSDYDIIRISRNDRTVIDISDTTKEFDDALLTEDYYRFQSIVEARSSYTFGLATICCKRQAKNIVIDAALLAVFNSRDVLVVKSKESISNDQHLYHYVDLRRLQREQVLSFGNLSHREWVAVNQPWYIVYSEVQATLMCGIIEIKLHGVIYDMGSTDLP